MIITQKFNSAENIDKEFIPSLEELLSECVPNFDVIKSHELNADENKNFTYYLFFGNQTNAPIGFAQLEITKDKESKNNFLKSIFKKKNTITVNKNEKSVSWAIPGCLKEGIIFDPQYSKYAGEKTVQIFNEFLEREDVHSQQMRFSGAYGEIQSHFKNAHIKNQDDVIIDTLIKNRGSYQEFINCLSERVQKQIKASWRFVQRELSYKMGEYDTLKEAFNYKDKGVEQYKAFKDHPTLKKYNSENAQVSFLTLETNYEVKCIILFVKGSGIHGFYDVINIDEMIPEIIPHQIAIMKFFENENCNRLHFLGETGEHDFFLELGFTYRKQHVVVAQKIASK